jgi:hypothetical protein
LRVVRGEVGSSVSFRSPPGALAGG